MASKILWLFSRIRVGLKEKSCEEKRVLKNSIVVRSDMEFILSVNCARVVRNSWHHRANRTSAVSSNTVGALGRALLQTSKFVPSNCRVVPARASIYTTLRSLWFLPGEFCYWPYCCMCWSHCTRTYQLRLRYFTSTNNSVNLYSYIRDMHKLRKIIS